MNILGREYTAFVLQGGQPDATHTYVEMPSGVLNGLEDVTVSCWVYMDEDNSGYQRIWELGSDTTSYMYMIANGFNEGHQGYTCALTNSGWGNERGPQSGKGLEAGKWIYTTMTFDGSEKQMSLYEDGRLIGTEKTDADLSVLQGTTNNWLGYGNFKNDIMNGMIADFKIYNYAMSADEIADEISIPDDERVARDKEALDLGDISAVTGNLELVSKGATGSSISWESSDTDVIKNDGTVIRPEAGRGDTKVTLTATISSGDVNDTKVFEVTVKQQMTAKEIVEADIAAIKLDGLNAVTDNLNLPQKGNLGSVITWTSSDETIISSDGTVTRPGGKAKEITLTAKAVYGEESIEKEFKATVLPRYEKKDIVKVDPVEAETAKGVLPKLPSTVGVTYENDTTGREKAVWPTDLKTEDFQEGVQEVIGNIVDYDTEVIAKVTVTDKGIANPQKSASGFDLSDISLDGTDTIFGQNMNRTLEYLKIMNEDRMLYNFRNAFGQDTKGAQPLTGWEEPTGLLRGHSTGHFLSALAQAYATTGNMEYKDKMDYMISELRKLQEMSKGEPQDFKTKCTSGDAPQSKWSNDPSTWGEGYISAYSPDQFALLEQYTPYATIWAPYYTMHKLLAGFIDSYNYGGNEEALKMAEDLGTWVYKRLSACTPEQRSQMWSMYIAGEYGGMNESLARLYEITEDEMYLKAANMFDNTDFFNGLANNVDTIQGRHANQHIPQIIGAIHEYAASGDAKYYNIAQNFWEMTISRYAYSIGGVGTGERFKDPYQQGNNILGNEGRGENCETCAAYNMLKLTMDLYNYNPDDASYMDYYERTMINQIAASQSHDTTEHMHNGVTYMLPVDPGQRREFDSDYGGFTCCNGTGMENHVKYQAAAYAQSGSNLYVNLYMPTTLNWEEKGIQIKQETKFPSEHSRLIVNGSGKFTMKLRVPYWATAGFKVTVNGKEICKTPEVSSYVAINRAWKEGDVVDIEMPYTLHLDKCPDKVDKSTVASLMYGPLVMVAKDNRSSYKPMNWYTLALSDELSESVQMVTGTDEEKVPHFISNGIDFYPMYDAYNYRYHAYVKVKETEVVVNKDMLNDLIASVTGENALDSKNYPEKLWKDFSEALSNAQKLAASQDATQSEIYDAYKTLKAAIQELKENENPIPNKPDNPDKPSNPDNPNNPDNPDKPNTPDSPSKPNNPGDDSINQNSTLKPVSTDKNTKTVKTGDSMEIGGLLVVCTASIFVITCLILIAIRRRRRE
ncbi:beta-L-arabinofuranosidase domain-containing protein [Clostridium sp. C105KSO13]|uniref:beta-L-arabinofuranosidase domain-containing protein n=1 Tax=Clostridium sp. C105KSO13 TaxID=1776045 RepID=UPI0007408617|nr:beta-L-arabinofuranosidase domain-containing protein [Clostridium sp. C105KSO13]CUX47135.1 Non-reducing end beta-L-arabinofuranosidase [Clostridium sp. C105KSO13]